MNPNKVFVGCCMAILSPDGKKVLVARRKKDPDKGGLQLPGGTVEYASGEDLRRAVVREIMEETGVEVSGVEFLCMMNTFYYGVERPLHIGFTGVAASEAVPPNPEPEKAEDWHWIELDNLPEDQWFRMSKVAIDFLVALRKDSSISRFVEDEEYRDVRP